MSSRRVKRRAIVYVGTRRGCAVARSLLTTLSDSIHTPKWTGVVRPWKMRPQQLLQTNNHLPRIDMRCQNSKKLPWEWK